MPPRRVNLSPTLGETSLSAATMVETVTPSDSPQMELSLDYMNLDGFDVDGAPQEPRLLNFRDY